MRKILGFAALAIVAWLILKIFFGLLGTIIGLGITVLMLAIFGYIVYIVLRVISPATADKVKAMIGGAKERVPHS